MRLCGIHQAIIELDVDVSKLAPMSISDVAALFKANPDELKLSISLIQAAWAQIISSEDLPSFSPPSEGGRKRGRPKKVADASPEEPTAKSSPKKQATAATPLAAVNKLPPLTLEMEQYELLDLADFSTKIFEYPNYTDEDERFREVEWLCGLIRDLKRVFDEPMARPVLRLALLNQLHLRRINDRLSTLDPATSEFVKLQITKKELESTYGSQWEQVEALCPSAAASLTRKQMINTFGDIVKVYQQWKADPNNNARDGIFTDDELQICFRTSLQAPDVPYRHGWVVACNEAKLGLGDPKWKRRMPQSICKILDASVQYAGRKMIEKMNLPRPDLESLGPEGDYPPIYQEADGEKSELTFEEIVETEGEPDVVIGEKAKEEEPTPVEG